MEVLSDKYYYAGGSARVMFMYQIQEVKTRLDKRLQNLEDKDWESLLPDRRSRQGRRLRSTL